MPSPTGLPDRQQTLDAHAAFAALPLQAQQELLERVDQLTRQLMEAVGHAVESGVDASEGLNIVVAGPSDEATSYKVLPIGEDARSFNSAPGEPIRAKQSKLSRKIEDHERAASRKVDLSEFHELTKRIRIETASRRAVRRSMHSRAPRAAGNTRTRGSRRVTSRSAGGGSSGDDPPGESAEPPSGRRGREPKTSAVAS
jgi:hypothetical protein